jgi:hypothetical protein
MGFDAWFDGTLGGYVWVCQDKVVANASIAPASPTGRQWVLSNVAVEEEYRGRGIGRRLVEACLQHAWREGAGQVLLQVWQANDPARHLYESLGFEPVSRLWRLVSGPQWPPAIRQSAAGAGLTWRAARGQDVEALRSMATAMMSYPLRLLRTSPLGAFRPGAWEAIRRLVVPSVAGLPERLVLLRGSRVVGGLALAPISRTQDRLHFVLPPDPPGDTVMAMADKAAELSLGRDVRWVTDIPESLDQLRQVLVRYGFEEQDALLQMALGRPYRAEWGLAV